jgi:Activator of Hsp90 ATPase homolog 1-like protein
MTTKLDTTTLPPLQHRVQVKLAPAAAFDLFTRGMARWWPFRGHSCFGDDAVDVVFEPRVGGAVTEIARDGRRMAWGTITAWSPPEGFAMRWFPGLEPAEATTLRVQFAAVAAGTEVSVHHSGWQARGAAAGERRDQYDSGWPATLAAFRAQADDASQGAA